MERPNEHRHRHVVSFHERCDDPDIETVLGADLEQLDFEVLRAIAFAVKT